MIWKLQPCTAYAVRKLIAGSPVQRLSDSAGSIYPTIERLLARRLVKAIDKKKGARPFKLLSVTPAGKKALQAWLFKLDPRQTFPEDPIRTRILILDLLDDRKKKEWLGAVKKLLVEQQKIFEEFEQNLSPKDKCYDLAHLNSRLLIEARIKWLNLIGQEEK